MSTLSPGIFSSRSRLRRQAAMFWLLRGIAAVNVLALVGVCAFLLWHGLPALSWEFLTEPPRKMMTEGGIRPCILGTAILSLGALLLAFPMGVASAVYLHEYAKRNAFARYVRLGVNNLAGVPSVVFGLFGLSFFVTFCGFGVSILSGVLTLAVLTLPVIIGTAEEALRSVPDTYREASRTWEPQIPRLSPAWARPAPCPACSPEPFWAWPAPPVKPRPSYLPPPCSTPKTPDSDFPARLWPCPTICTCWPRRAFGYQKDSSCNTARVWC